MIKNYDNENIKDKRIHIWDCNKFISKKTFIHNFFLFFLKTKPLKKLRDEKR